MRFSTRSKVGGLLSLLAIVTIITAFMLGGVVFRGPTTHASNAQYSATPDTLAPAGTVNLRNVPTNLSLAAGASFTRGPRPIHPVKAPGLSGVQPIPSSPITDQTKSLITKFNGVSSRDSAVTNFGAQFEPPDQGLCVGNGFVVEPVNSAFTIYHTNGSVVAGPFNVNVLFGEGLKQFTSDPRCYFDKATNTWFAIILFINAPFTGARTDLAVNTSGDPTTTWTFYHINATDQKGPGCPCFGDQPLLGIDQENLYLSTNEFSILGPQFNGAQIYAISKADLVSLDQHIHFVHFGHLSIGGTIAASVQPAITTGSSNAEYFMNSLDPNGTGDHRLGVWAITDEQAVSEGKTPALSSLVITSEAYAVPPGAQQKGASSLLDSGDDRMQQVQFINGDLWGALDTAVTILNDTTKRAGAAWFEVQPQLDASGQLISSASIVRQGYVATLGNYLLYPAIQVAPEGTAAIVMTLSGQNYFP